MDLLSINDVNYMVAPLKFALEKRCSEVFFNSFFFNVIKYSADSENS